MGLSLVKCWFNGLSGKPRYLAVPALSRIPSPKACLEKTALHLAPGYLGSSLFMPFPSLGAGTLAQAQVRAQAQELNFKGLQITGQ